MLLGNYKDLKKLKKKTEKEILKENFLIYTHSLEYYYHAPKEALIVSPRLNFPKNYEQLPIFFTKKKEGARFIDPKFFLEGRRVDFFEHPFKEFAYKENFQLKDQRVIFDNLIHHEKNEEGYLCLFQEKQFQVKNFVSDLLTKNKKEHYLLLKVQGDEQGDFLLKKDHYFLGNPEEGWFLTLVENQEEKTILKALKELKSLLKKQSLEISLEGLYLEQEERDFFLKPLNPSKKPW